MQLEDELVALGEVVAEGFEDFGQSHLPVFSEELRIVGDLLEEPGTPQTDNQGRLLVFRPFISEPL